MPKNRDQSSDFKKLQNEWYQKLKDDGFEDIEDTRSPQRYLKTWHASYFQCRYTEDLFQIKEEYYRRRRTFLHEYPFKNKNHERIWQLHSDAISMREIASILKEEGMKMNKDQINQIIFQYQKIMQTFVFESMKDQQLDLFP